MKKLIWATAVWGRAYLDLLRSVHFPSLMAPGNFPALGREIDSYIYTSVGDAEEVAHIASGMSRFGHVRIFMIEDWPPPPFAGMVGAMHDAVGRAWEEDAGLLYTFPDTVVADGVYATVASAISRGFRACMTAAGIAAMEAPVRDELMRRRGDAQVIAIPGAELAALGLAYLHPFSRAAQWQSPQFILTPSMIQFAADGCYAIHSFHQVPVFVYARRKATDFRLTLDSDFMDVTGLTREEIVFLDRAQDYAILELLSPKAKAHEIPAARTASVAEVVSWAARVTTPMNRWLFSRRYMISGVHGSPMPEADRVVRQILDALGSGSSSTG